jgi:hypothetical protein
MGLEGSGRARGTGHLWRVHRFFHGLNRRCSFRDGMVGHASRQCKLATARDKALSGCVHTSRGHSATLPSAARRRLPQHDKVVIQPVTEHIESA